MTRRVLSVAVALAVLFLWLAPAHSKQDAAETQVFAVEGMTCALCGKAISKSLRRVEGVREVHVDQDAERVMVVASQGVRTASLLAAIENAGGYTATPIGSDPAPAP